MKEDHSRSEAAQLTASGLRQSTWYVAEKLLRLGGTFLLTAAIARHLGPEQFATLALATAVTTVLGFLGSFGLESVVLRDLSQRPHDAPDIVSGYFRLRWLGALLVPLLSCSYVLLAHPTDEPLLLITAILACSGLCMSLDVVDLLLQSRSRALLTSAIRAAAFALAAAVKIGLLLASASLLWFAAAQLLELALVASVYAVLVRHAQVSPAPPGAGKRAWTLLRDGRHMVLSGLTVALYSKIDMLVIGQTLSKQALGTYAIAAAICGAVNIVGMSISQSFAPRLSHAHSADPAVYRYGLRSFLALMLGTSIALAASTALIAPWLVEWLAGPAFSSSADILRVLAWSCVPVFMGIATSQIIVNEHLYGLSLLRTTAGLVFIGGTIIPVAEHWGTIGVAWSMVASACVATGMLLASSTARQQLTGLWQQGSAAQ